MTRVLATVSLLLASVIGVSAHQLIVFASVDCEVVLVEAKFSSGRVVQKGDVRILDGQNALLKTLQIGSDGTVTVPLDSVDHSEGLLIEVDTNGHENYWIVTPEDIARNCRS